MRHFCLRRHTPVLHMDMQWVVSVILVALVSYWWHSYSACAKTDQATHPFITPIEVYQATIHFVCGVWVPKDIRIWVCSYSHHVWSAKWGSWRSLCAYTSSTDWEFQVFCPGDSKKKRSLHLPGSLLKARQAVSRAVSSHQHIASLHLSPPLALPPPPSIISTIDSSAFNWQSVCMSQHCFLPLSSPQLSLFYVLTGCLTLAEHSPFLNLIHTHTHVHVHTHTHFPLLPPYTSCLLVLGWLARCYCEFSQCATADLIYTFAKQPMGEYDPDDTCVSLWHILNERKRGRNPGEMFPFLSSGCMSVKAKYIWATWQWLKRGSN